MNKNLFESERPYKTYLSKDTLIDESQVGFFFIIILRTVNGHLLGKRRKRKKNTANNRTIAAIS